MAKNKVITVQNLPVTISFENTDNYRKDLQWIPYAADREDPRQSCTKSREHMRPIERQELFRS